LVFDELLFSKLISRIASKEILNRLSRTLERHGETYAFFTIGELSRSGLYSNTAYIVKPNRDEKGRRWLAYPKKTLTNLDKDTIAAIAKKKRRRERKATIERLEGHFERRGNRGGEEHDFDTPTITIGGRKVAIAACADVLGSRSIRDSDLVIVPSQGNPLSMMNFDLLAKEMRMKEGSKIVFTDALGQKRAIRELNLRWAHPLTPPRQLLWSRKAKFDFKGPLILKTRTQGKGAIRPLKKGRIHRL